MSIWRDIHERSNGIKKRQEDLIPEWEPEIDWPIIRKVFSKTIANDIIPVQPMSEPTGNIHYFDFKP